MRRFTITTRFKLIIVLLALVVVLSIGGSVVVANLFLGGGGAAGAINLQKGLVGHWKFNGTAQDSTPQGNDGTVTEAVLTTDRKGQTDKAYDFDGTNDIIQTANSISIFNIATELTVAAWFYVDTGNSSWQRPFQKFQDLSDGNGIPYGINYGTAAQKWGCEYRNAAQTEYPNITSSGTYSSGSWYHVACVASKTSATEFVLYVNGVEVGSQSTWFTSGDIDTGSRPITFGGARNAGTYWNGKIDDARIYNRALSAAEVTALYNSYDPGVAVSTLQQGLVGHWKLDGNANDSSPYRNHGTATGTALTSDRKNQSNKAYDFDGGASTNISVTDTTSSSLDLTTAVTVAAWVNVQTTGTKGIVSKGGAGGNEPNGPYSLWTIGTTIYWEVGDDVIGTAISSTLTASTWQHWVGTYSSSSLSLYRNGALVAGPTGVAVSSMVQNNNALLFADSAGTITNLDAFIDDVRIYNRALSAAEITALYNSYDPGAVVSTLQKGLIGHWDFGAGSTTTATPDRTPYNKDGTVTGATISGITDRKGQSGKAYSFDGTDDVIDMGANFTVANGDTRSFAFWVNPSDNGVYDFILSKSNGCGNYGQYTIRSAAGGVTFNYVNDALTITDYTGPAAALSTWSHYVITYTFGTGSSMAMYKNGALASGSWDADAGNLVVTGTYLGNFNLGRFGTCTGADYHFAGSIDDVRIYNRALSAAEVLALYESYR